MNKKIITCTGYGTTGSSAATNILEEFENIMSLDSGFECTFLHESDGIRDLENALREGHRLKTDMAIKRFLRLVKILNRQKDYKKYFNGNFEKHSAEYIASICKADWQGNWHRGSDTIKFSKEDLLYINLAKQVFLNEYSYSKYSLFEPDTWHPSYQVRNKSYYAFFDENFYLKTQAYLKNLIAELDKHTSADNILIDQFFSAYDIEAYTNYLPDTKIIIVDRDPRDMYVLNKIFWGEPYIPSEEINTFISWYKGIRFSQEKQKENKNVIIFRFEDFIFNYELSLEKIKSFLGFEDSAHKNKKKYFNPADSSKNVKRFIEYPHLKKDIEKIEKELSSFCYPFPNDGGTVKLSNEADGKTVNNYDDFSVEKCIQKAHSVQVLKTLPENYKKKTPSLLFGITKLGQAIESMLHRKNLKAKVRGFVKCAILLPSVLYEYPLILFLYLRHKTK